MYDDLTPLLHSRIEKDFKSNKNLRNTALLRFIKDESLDNET